MASRLPSSNAVSVSEKGSSKFAQAGPYKVHYHDSGQGSAVIMLHGGGPGASGWSNFHKNVDAFSVEHRVLLVDMLNFGKSEAVIFDDEPSTTVRARAIRDLMDTLGIQRASLVGNSLGGTVALAFAVDFPERVDKLVLMGPAGLSRTVMAPQPTEGHKLLRAAAINPSLETMQALVNVMLYDPSVVSRETIESRVAAAKDREQREAAEKSTAPQRDQRDEYPKVSAKTLIIWGREDRVNPLEIGMRLLRDIPDCRLLVFKNCGHWAQIEHSEEFNDVSLNFLAGN